MVKTGQVRILVVEDDESIADVVCTALRYSGYLVDHVSAGAQGLQRGLEGIYDLIVLDVMLPGLDGFEICRRLRDRSVASPILFLTARADPDDRINGFVAGGDDYLAKPFSVDELVLRVAAILKRTSRSVDRDIIRVEDLTLEPSGQEVRRDGELVELSATEFRLLHYLMRNAGIVVSKSQILDNVWDDGFEGTENIVELYVGYLRRKLDDDKAPLIHTRRGAGYVLRQGER